MSALRAGALTVESMSVEYDWDPKRRALAVSDPRLTRVLLREPDRCATLNEYAAACGMDPSEIVELLGKYLDQGVLGLDFFGDEVFLHTAPSGRPAAPDFPDVPPNLWEQLRERAGLEAAYALWKLIRSLERSGWGVEHRVNRIVFGMGQVADPPYIGVRAGQSVVPALIFPSQDALIRSGGLLDQYEFAGAAAVAVICDERALDNMVTAVRRWSLVKRAPATLSVLVLESPRYNPTLLSPSDVAIEPVAVTRDTLGNYFW